MNFSGREACLTCLALCEPKVGKAPYRSPRDDTSFSSETLRVTIQGIVLERTHEKQGIQEHELKGAGIVLISALISHTLRG
jgi:hypothetical protein